MTISRQQSLGDNQGLNQVAASLPRDDDEVLSGLDRLALLDELLHDRAIAAIQSCEGPWQ